METKSIDIFQNLIHSAFEGGKIDVPATASAGDWREAFGIARLFNMTSLAAAGLGEVANPELTDPKVDLHLLAEQTVVENKRRLGVLRDFGAFCAENDTKVLLLKGMSLMDCYTDPMLRPLSDDIDVMLLPAGAKDCSAIAPEKVEAALAAAGTDVRQTTEKHAVFDWKGVHFESHRTMLSVDVDPNIARAEDIVKDFVKAEGLRELSVAGETIPNVFMLPPRANAVFLLRHMASHFATHRGLLARSFVDWGCFLRSNAAVLENNENGGQKLSAALLICGLDKIVAIFNQVAGRFVPGCEQAGRAILPIPSRYDSYAPAAERAFRELFDEHPELPEGCCIRRLAMKLRRLSSRRWKYKYLPESWCGVLRAASKKACCGCCK